MHFTNSELAAIARMALYIAKADGQQHQKESDAIYSELGRFGIASDDLPTILVHALNLPFDEASQIISSFSQEEKRYVTAYLGALICVDDNVSDSEMKLWQTISCRCNLPTMSLYDACRIMQSFSLSDPKTQQLKNLPKEQPLSWEEFKRKKEAEEEEKRRRQRQRELEEKRKAEEYRIERERRERIEKMEREAAKVTEEIEKKCSIKFLLQLFLMIPLFTIASIEVLQRFDNGGVLFLLLLFLMVVIGFVFVIRCYIDIDNKKQEWRDKHPDDPIGSYL